MELTPGGAPCPVALHPEASGIRIWRAQEETGAVNEMMQDVLQRGALELGSLTSRVAIAALVVIAAFTMNRMLRRGLQRRHAFIELPAYGQALIANVATVATALIVGTAILALWGVTWSTIAAGIGLSTLAIALGLQDVLKSLAGGVVIMLERPFDIGDRIRIKDLEGEVIDMRVRSMVLRMDNGHLAQAPNGLLFSETFENLSRTEAYFYSIVMTGLDEAPPAARAAILETLKGVEEFAHAPDIMIQRDLSPRANWHLGRKTGTARSGQTNQHPRRARRRAVVSWQSDAEEAALACVVERLASRYPDAHIEIRKR